MKIMETMKIDNMYSNYNMVLVHTESLKRAARLNSWIGGFVCENCKRDRTFPYVCNGNIILCKWCSVEQERKKWNSGWS